MAKTFNMYATSSNEVVYATDSHTVSHTDTLAVRRTLPKVRKVGASVTTTPLRVNHLFVESIGEYDCIVSITTTVPVGVDTDAAKAFVSTSLADFASTVADRSVTGDIID